MSYMYLDAADFLRREICSFEHNLPVVVDNITPDDFEAVSAKLKRYFPGAAVVAEKDGCAVESKVGKLEYCKKLTVKPSTFLKRNYYSFGDLIEIIRRLMDPDGCPWDRAQTHASIRGNLIEEAYELAEAVDLGDVAKMTEESGDVLLQGLFHAEIGERDGEYSVNDVINGLCAKLVGRHTHIFGEHKAGDAAEALMYWEKAKAKEKGQSGLQDKIDSVPVTFTALMRANKVQKIIKKTGFDFADVNGAAQKVGEELQELLAASPEKQEGEGGDLLFAAVNVLRMLKIDPELALNATTDKFIRRFAYVEKRAAEEEIELSAENIDLMEEWYQEYKRLYEAE